MEYIVVVSRKCTKRVLTLHMMKNWCKLLQMLLNSLLWPLRMCLPHSTPPLIQEIQEDFGTIFMICSSETSAINSEGSDKYHEWLRFVSVCSFRIKDYLSNMVPDLKQLYDYWPCARTWLLQQLSQNIKWNSENFAKKYILPFQPQIQNFKTVSTKWLVQFSPGQPPPKL